MEQNVDLLASYWTIAGGAEPHTDHEYSHFDFRDRVAEIARVGFRGMGLWHADLEYTLRSHSLEEMKQILDDHGIIHIELEFLQDWFVDGEARRSADQRKGLLLRAAQKLGARHVKVGDFFNQVVPMPKLVQEFRSLCREAAEHGTKIGFELMPFSMLTTLESTLTMLTEADAPNGGVILDLWHLVKLGIPFHMATAIPRRFLIGVELNDGYLKSELDLVTETTQHRQLCGEGEFDVKGFVAAMRDSGYEGPYGIEVLNAQLRKRPLKELAQVAYSTTRAQFVP
ncbi:MAG: sugar phosphate isomerase/epimerase [Acidobacteriota bacterium]|nr:sugar phosphate isomerase/epimerase [Acidobacteriota bacterium]